MADFYNDLFRGKCGEKAVIAALQAKEHIVEDVSDNWEYRSRDIDLLLSKNGNTTSLEIKNDLKSEITGNFFIEFENRNNKSHNYKGWYRYCEAEHICFLQENNHKAFIVSMDELKERIRKGKYKFANSCDTYGLLLPVAQLYDFSTLYILEV